MKMYTMVLLLLLSCSAHADVLSVLLHGVVYQWQGNTQLAITAGEHGSVFLTDAQSVGDGIMANGFEMPFTPELATWGILVQMQDGALVRIGGQCFGYTFNAPPLVEYVVECP